MSQQYSPLNKGGSSAEITVLCAHPHTSFTLANLKLKKPIQDSACEVSDYGEALHLWGRE